MTVKRNDCCDCAVPSYPCIHCSEDYEVEVCDDCREEADELYEHNDGVLCIHCLLKATEVTDDDVQEACCTCGVSSGKATLYFYQGNYHCEDCLNTVILTP